MTAEPDIYGAPDEYPDVEMDDDSDGMSRLYLVSKLSDKQCRWIAMSVVMAFACLAFFSIFAVTMYRVYNNQFPS